MYIAHISTSTTLNQTIYNQMVYQKKCGNRVAALCPDDEWTLKLKEKGIEVFDVPLLRHRLFANFILSLPRIWAICRREKFDVVHTHTLLPGIVGRIAARLAGVPAVIHTFHMWPPHLWKNPFFVLGFNLSEFVAAHFGHAILFQNHDDWLSWKKIPGVPDRKSVLIGNGIDSIAVTQKVTPGASERIRKELGITNNTRVLVMVARLDPQKGHFFFMDVIRKLKDEFPEEFVVLLVGLGKDQGKLEEAATRMGLGDIVYFMGFRNDVSDILAASDVSVLTSHFEGIPRALMESMILELPVVATNVPGTKELVRHNENGLLVEFGDVPGFVNALVRVLTDQKLAQGFGKSGRELVANNFDEYVIADRVEEIYLHVMEKKGMPLPSWEHRYV